MLNILSKIQERNFGKEGDESNHYYKNPDNKFGVPNIRGD